MGLHRDDRQAAEVFSFPSLVPVFALLSLITRSIVLVFYDPLNPWREAFLLFRKRLR